MINLSLDELRLIAQIRNISDYENKSKEDLIKALRETKQTPKPELKPKPETPKPKPKTPKTRKKTKQTKPEAEPEPKPEIRVNKRKLKKLRKDFDELKHKFSKKEIKEYRKTFYNVKSTKNFIYQKSRRQAKILLT